MKALTAIVAAVLCVAISGHEAQAQRSTADGVFTAEQAKAGETAYQSHCSGCHGLDLKKTDAEAPDLTEGPFRFGWQGKTVAERFDKIRTTMPKQPLPRLDDKTYIDVIAYILSFNGIPAGSEALPADMAKLESITIEVPQAKGGGGRRR
jgi:S-disulfanyl-L-cysteine oxidoreductase SoxD